MKENEQPVTPNTVQNRPAVTEDRLNGQAVEPSTESETANTTPPSSAAVANELAAGPVKVKLATGGEMVIFIDPEFRKKLRAQTEQERDWMEQNLLRDRYMLLTVWRSEGRDYLLDGHSGLPFCLKHDIPVHIKTVDPPDRQAALLWIRDNQGGRRNWSRKEFEYELGTVYNETKQTHGGNRKHQDSSGNNQHLKTADALAAEHGVAPATVRNAGNYAKAVDGIAEVCGDEAKQVVLGDKAGLTMLEVVELVKDNPDPAALKDAVEMHLSEEHESNPLGHREGETKKEQTPGKKKGRIKKKKEVADTSTTSEDPALAFSKVCELLGENLEALADTIIKVLAKEKGKLLVQCLDNRLAQTETPPATEEQPANQGRPTKPENQPTPRKRSRSKAANNRS